MRILCRDVVTRGTTSSAVHSHRPSTPAVHSSYPHDQPGDQWPYQPEAGTVHNPQDLLLLALSFQKIFLVEEHLHSETAM